MFKYTKENRLEFLTSGLLDSQEGLSHLYTTRHGGVSTGAHDSLSFRYSGNTRENVHENFAIVARQLGGSFDDIVRTQQVHKDKVCAVTGGEGFRIVSEDNDALVTNIPGVILGAFYADCQVLLFFDPVNRACAAAHSGWRGTVLDISLKTIDLMSQLYGTKAGDVLCTIGPSICQSCFECDFDVVDALTAAFGSDILKYVMQKGEKYHIDITGVTVSRLLSAGIKRENIDASNICTFCNPDDLFWSHRKIGDNRGVHGGFITLK